MENVVLEPPLYFANDHIFDVCFHPKQDFLTAAIITGEVKLLSYNSDDVKEVISFGHHTSSCRQAIFSADGNVLATVSKDKSIGILDSNGKLQIHIKKAHEDAINCEYFLNNETIATGDDSGEIKIWDLRNPKKQIFDVKEQEETITDFVSTDNNYYLLSSCQDGTLGVYDLRKSNNSDAKLYALSDELDEDLTSVCLIKNDQFVACSTSEGAILFFKWDHFGDFKDRMIGHPNSIDTMIKYDENTLITGAEDGFVRAVSIYPNDIVATLGQHEEDEQFPVSKISMSHCRRFLASSSHDSSIKFYDISYLAQMRQNASVFSQEQIEQQQQTVILNKPIKQKKVEDDMEEEEKTNKNKSKNKKKQLEDDFSDDDDDEDDDSMDDEDSDDLDSDEDDDSDELEQEFGNKKNKKRNMSKGKSNVKQRAAEIKKQNRMNFFQNI